MHESCWSISNREVTFITNGKNKKFRRQTRPIQIWVVRNCQDRCRFLSSSPAHPPHFTKAWGPTLGFLRRRLELVNANNESGRSRGLRRLGRSSAWRRRTRIYWEKRAGENKSSTLGRKPLFPSNLIWSRGRVQDATTSPQKLQQIFSLCICLFRRRSTTTRYLK